MKSLVGLEGMETSVTSEATGVSNTGHEANGFWQHKVQIGVERIAQNKLRVLLWIRIGPCHYLFIYFSWQSIE